MASLAQMERELVIERTRAGLAVARKLGRVEQFFQIDSRGKSHAFEKIDQIFRREIPAGPGTIRTSAQACRRGVKFADVRDGSPAAKAGLKAGDILVEFDGKRIQNLYDFTYALRAKKPGDTVLVKVIRSGQTIEAKVLLAERK